MTTRSPVRFCPPHGKQHTNASEILHVDRQGATSSPPVPACPRLFRHQHQRQHPISAPSSFPISFDAAFPPIDRLTSYRPPSTLSWVTTLPSINVGSPFNHRIFADSIALYLFLIPRNSTSSPQAMASCHAVSAECPRGAGSGAGEQGSGGGQRSGKITVAEHGTMDHERHDGITARLHPCSTPSPPPSLSQRQTETLLWSATLSFTHLSNPFAIWHDGDTTLIVASSDSTQTMQLYDFSTCQDPDLLRQESWRGGPG